MDDGASRHSTDVSLVQQLRSFKFTPGMDMGPNVDIIPPPLFTHMSLPFNYYYSQNPYVRTTEDGDTINTTAVKQVGYFIGADDPAPTGPQIPPDVTDARTMEIIAQLEEAFQDRPVWTRRSLLNHMAGQLRNWNELKKYLNYTAYQFKGGPWRDGVVPYGTDPRTDPKYRVYQTLMFKLSRKKLASESQTWQSLRRSQLGSAKDHAMDRSQSHTFDGESYHTDGKVWQVCDISDPLLKELLDKAEVRPTWDLNSGWYHGGLWAKVKAIMKTKLVAIQFGRRLTRTDFAPTLECGDRTPTKSSSTTFHLPLPNIGLTKEELTLLRGREPPKKKSAGYNARLRDPGKTPSIRTEPTPASPAPESAAVPGEQSALLDNEEDDDESGSEAADGADESDDELYPQRVGYEPEEPVGKPDPPSGGGNRAFPIMGSHVYPELD